MKFCEDCNIQVEEALFQGHLRSNEHKKKSCEKCCETGLTVIKSAFKNRIISYKIENELDNDTDIHRFLEKIQVKLQDAIKFHIVQHNSLKVNVELFATYILPSKHLTEVKSFNTKNFILTVASNLRTFYEEISSIIHTKMTEFAEKDSGDVYILNCNFILLILLFL